MEVELETVQIIYNINVAYNNDDSVSFAISIGYDCYYYCMYHLKIIYIYIYLIRLKFLKQLSSFIKGKEDILTKKKLYKISKHISQY